MVLVILDSLFVTAEVIIDAENKDENESARIAAEVFKYMGFIILCVMILDIIESTLKIELKSFDFKDFRHRNKCKNSFYLSRFSTV